MPEKANSKLAKILSYLPGFRFWFFSFLIGTLFGLLISVLLFSTVVDPMSSWRTLLLFVRTILYFQIWAILAPMIFLVVNAIGVKSARRLVIGSIVHVPVAMLLTVSHSIVFFPVMLVTGRYLCEGECDNLDPSGAWITTSIVLLGFITYAFAVIGILLHVFLQYLRFEEERNLKLQNDLSNSQLTALKMQIQPHFLFNTLHSISSLTLSDPLKANEMIASLGEFLRMTLEGSDEQMTSLENELEFVRHYLDIEQVRFNDRLKIRIEVPERLMRVTVPHLILQPIVENAVKHGIAANSEKGVVSIIADSRDELLILEVRNSTGGQSKTIGRNNGLGTGKGFLNVCERLERIYGRRAVCELVFCPGEAKVEMMIPFEEESMSADLNEDE